MAYVQGGLIEAVDFNTFRTQLLQVYGLGFGNSGYGQTAITVPSVAGGLVEIVKSVEWTRFRNAISACALHQATATALLPPTGVLQPGEIVIAHDGVTDADDFPQMLADITANRLNAPLTSMTVFTNRSTQTVTNAWNTSATTTLDLTWPSVDAARHFFNSGGQIRVRASRSGGTVSTKNTSWTNLLNSVGFTAIDHNDTTRSGTNGTVFPFGYYTLPTAAFQDVMVATAVGYGYGGNTYTVAAQAIGVTGVRGNNGITVRVRVTLADPTLGVVNGNLTVEIDELRATTHLTIPSFTVNIVSPLTAV